MARIAIITPESASHNKMYLKTSKSQEDRLENEDIKDYALAYFHTIINEFLFYFIKII